MRVLKEQVQFRKTKSLLYPLVISVLSILPSTGIFFHKRLQMHLLHAKLGLYEAHIRSRVSFKIKLVAPVPKLYKKVGQG